MPGGPDFGPGNQFSLANWMRPMIDRYSAALDKWEVKLAELEALTGGDRDQIARSIQRCKHQIDWITNELQKVDDDYAKVVDP